MRLIFNGPDYFYMCHMIMMEFPECIAVKMDVKKVTEEKWGPLTSWSI